VGVLPLRACQWAGSQRLGCHRFTAGVGVVLEDTQAQQELLKARSDLVVIITELNPQQYALLHSSDASCALGEEAVFCERMPLRRRWPHDSQDRRALRTGLKRKEHAMSCTIDSNRVSGGGD